MKKYKYSREEIAKLYPYQTIRNGEFLRQDLLSLADKPKCKTCDNKAVSSSGHCMACLSCHPLPLNPKPEIEKIDWNGFLCKPDWRKFDEITGAINNLVNRVNLLSTEDKEGL